MSNLLVNPSFETQDERGPAQWEYAGPEEYRRATLAAPEAHDGEHAILFTNIRGQVSWTSAPVPVRAGATYGLSWWTKIAGREPWHWSYYAKQAIRVLFLDERGNELPPYERRIRCIGSAGWVRAWIKFEAPPQAHSAQVQLLFECDIETDGQALLDDFYLEEITPLVPSDKTAVLRCAIRDARTRQPLTARCYVRTDGGEYLLPKYCYWAEADGLAFHTLSPDFEIEVPAGAGRIEAYHGLEYDICIRPYEVAAGETKDIVLPLHRRFDASERRWFCGEAHHHLFFHRGTRHPQMTIDHVMAIAQAEGLNFLSFQGEITELLAHLDNHQMHRREDFVGEVGIESVSDIYGHMSNIFVTALPDYEPLNGQHGVPMQQVLWPPNVTMIRHQRQHGGASAYCHPLDHIDPADPLASIANPERMLCARELPVDLALGETPALDLLCEETPGTNIRKMQEYYRLLNLGFRFGVVASTDYYCDQAEGHPGANRTYVRVHSLDFACIADAYRRGATFCTNGPLLFLTVNGIGPGEEVRLQPGISVPISVEALSLWGLSRAEIIVNGKVLRTLYPADNGQIVEQFDFRPEQSCWVCARAFGPGARLVHMRDIAPEARTREGQFAHTSPAYITVPGRPLQPNREDALYYAAWCEAAMRAVEARADLFAKDCWGPKPDPEALKQRVLEQFEQARQFFLSLARA